MAVSLGSIKRGDTFAFSASFMDGDTPLTGIASDLKCQVREEASAESVLLSELVVSEDVVPGVYVFTHSGDTRLWPTRVFFDIQLSDGTVQSTDTYFVKIKEDVTNG